ncbi:MAG: hypothetical protein WCI45_02250 [Desulfuromonadales bacterium]
MGKIFVLFVVLFLGLLGCGNSTGSSTDLNTVYLAVSPSSSRLEADVLTGNSCTNGGGTYTTESIPITITSTAYSTALVKSPVTINNIKVSYSKYNTNSTAPTLLDQYDTGLTINPDEVKTFNVNVATDKLKLDLVQTYNFNLCSLDYWEYYATITFSGVEDYTKKSFSFSTIVKVAFADRNNL